MDSIPVDYQGCELSAVVVHAAGEFVSTVLIERPGGVRRAVGPFRPFDTARAAEQFAIQYGKDELDGRHVPKELQMAAG
ncbi:MULTISPECIES: hypothetical protein [Caballeronia]|jgi:hypothetical protein|uniref:Uncharacterized protein n=1 Tax=Caballeronia grimmiae TaxID=1071679 RepID=A0A069P4R6_9BURK|nr:MULTISPECIES: hypothetical protein [Caballeronia]KDR34904.1 hypothetical protein BG57_02840 [Caballeronia grimmiae]MDR5735473.1 hypothetical protein [Caballeronia sp. LZ025]GGD64560.1 hypothetical protein GCM10010985_18320 [Caballeronia grimmiae]